MIKFKNTMDRFFGKVVNVSQTVAACFLVVMILTVSLQVIGRIFTFKIPVTEEIATYSLIWMTYCASVAVTAKAEHLTVDILLNRYSPAARRVVRVLISTMILIFCGMLMIFGFMLVNNKVIITGRTPALQISRVWIYMSVPIAMTFNSAYMIYDVIIAVYDLVSGGKLSALDEAKKAALEAAEREAQAEEEAAIRAAMLGGSDNKTEEEDK